MVSITPIANLPAATSLSGNEAIPAVQSGSPVRITPAQIVALATMVSAVFTAEQLTVSALNTVSHLTFTPKNGLVILFVNGQAFFSVGAAAAFSVVTQTITWTSTTYSIQTSDTVYAVYGV